MMRFASMVGVAPGGWNPGSRWTLNPRPSSSVEFVSALLRLGEVEVAGVDRTAADHALDALVLHGAELLDVTHRGQATGGNHGDRQRLRQLHGGVDVDAGEHAVAADVGIDDGLDAQSSNFLARSTTSWPVSLLQPSVATLPSFASRPTMMWPPKAVQASFRKPGFFTAAVPMIT